MSCSKRFFDKSIFDWRPFQGIFGFLSSNFGLESSHWNKISYFNSYLRMVKSSLKMVGILYLKCTDIQCSQMIFLENPVF